MGRRGRPPKVVETTDPAVLAERRGLWEEVVREVVAVEPANDEDLVRVGELTIPELLHLLADRFQARGVL